MNKNAIYNLCVGSIQTNCWIYPLPDHAGQPAAGRQPAVGPQSCVAQQGCAAQQSCAVIDPGADAPLIIRCLKENNLIPRYMLLTHGHFDHITALPDLLAVFPATVIIHEGDASYLKNIQATFLNDGDSAGPFRLLHVPGHTPGSVAYYDEENAVLFTGDTLFRADCGRTDLPGGSQAKLEKSLERLLSMDGNIRALPGHGPETTIAEEAGRGLSFFIG